LAETGHFLLEGRHSAAESWSDCDTDVLLGSEHQALGGGWHNINAALCYAIIPMEGGGVGLRDTGDIFTVETLGRQAEAVAVQTAQMLADIWQTTVNLYRVPYVSFGSARWRDDQMELVQQFVPTRTESGRGLA
jgi:hypothetical protein